MNAKLYKKAIAGTILLIQMTAFSLPAFGAGVEGLQNFSKKQTYTNSFEDLKEKQWYKDVVKSCYEMGLMVGRSSNQFAPMGNVTVAEAISFGARIHCIYNSNTIDVNEKQENKNWYDGAIKYAIDNTIIKADDFSNYNRPATRQEIAYIICNVLPEDQWEVVRDVKYLPDVKNTNKNFQEIIKLYRAGIITGYDEYGTFKCDTNISRAEIAATINRIVIKDNRCRIPLAELEDEQEEVVKVPRNENQDTNKDTNSQNDDDVISPGNNDNVKESIKEEPIEEVDNSLEAYAKEVVRLVNVERQKAGLSPVESLSNVTGAANIRAKEISGNFSHTRPDGSSPFTVLDSLKGDFRTMGENIAMGQRSPAEVMDGWMNSPGHRQNILKANFTGLGVGVYQSASGTLCWVQLFVG